MVHGTGPDVLGRSMFQVTRVTPDKDLQFRQVEDWSLKTLEHGPFMMDGSSPIIVNDSSDSNVLRCPPNYEDFFGIFDEFYFV